MADTLQIVQWSLERACPFRTGDNWYLPGQAADQLHDLTSVSCGEVDKRVLDGICVTGWGIGHDSSNNYFDIPFSGFRVDKSLAKFGGYAAAKATCQACEANVPSETKGILAGCRGSLEIWPDSEELEDRLWKIIEDKNLEGPLKSIFSVTTPLWYGFWIDTPLKRGQAEFLQQVLASLTNPDDREDDEVKHFVSALSVSIQWELPLHVELLPLGHADCGSSSIFPHCPHCKANAPVGRWLEEYTTEPYECRVCGHTFVPNEHHSSETDDDSWISDRLEQQLGKEGLEDFTRRYLVHRGCSEQQADEVIFNEHDGPLLREVARTRTKRDATIRKLRAQRASRPARDLPRTFSLALNDDITLELVLIPSGEFLMGSPEPSARPDEIPRHLVRFEQPFYMGRHPVTQAQWSTVMSWNPSRSNDDAQLPVHDVSWIDCQEFCEILCNRQQRVIRLPSEAEWEYTCRAGTETRFAFGDSLTSAQANFVTDIELRRRWPVSEEEAVQLQENFENTDEKESRRPSPLGRFAPNAWGLCDMHGNVLEWCEDVAHDNYEGAPADGSAWLEGEDREPHRVVRGGSCFGSDVNCASSGRSERKADSSSVDFDLDPTIKYLFETSVHPVGFRIVCEAQ